MISSLFGGKATALKIVCGVVLACYGVLSLYAQFVLQPKTSFLLSGTEYSREDALVVPEYIASAKAYATISGFRVRLCSPVFSSPETPDFPPAALTLPGCVYVTVPYIGNDISFMIPDAEASVVYEGTHRLVTRSSIYGTILFPEYKSARGRVHSVLLNARPLSGKMWTEHVRFYTERPGKKPAYAAAESLSVAWESAEGNTAVARPGQRLMINIKHIISGVPKGSEKDKDLFPISLSAEFRMRTDSDATPEEDVLIDGAKLFFKNFAISVYGKASPAGPKHMYPKADITVEIDNIDEAMQSSLPAALFLPRTPEQYKRGRRIAQRMLDMIKTEQADAGRLRRFKIVKDGGKPLYIGGMTVERLRAAYNKARRR